MVMTAPAIHYRGFAHCHSTISYDGKYSYAQLRNMFLNHGLHFVCMTEHIEHLNQSDIEAVIEGCKAHSDDKFLFIPGIEMDDFVIYFIGLKPVKVDFTSSRTLFDSLAPAADMCVFSHPIKAKYRYPDWLMQRCDGVEIWNTKHDGIHFPRRQSCRLLDDVKKIRPRAVGLAGMDFHRAGHLSPVNMKLSAAGPLTQAFVLEEIKNGRFEVCRGDVNVMAASGLQKRYLWFRISLMDGAHAVHSWLGKRGFAVPKPVKKWFRVVMEGK